MSFIAICSYICIVYTVFLFILITTLPHSPFLPSSTVLLCFHVTCGCISTYLLKVRLCVKGKGGILSPRYPFLFFLPVRPLPSQSPSFMPCIYNLDSTYGEKTQYLSESAIGTK